METATVSRADRTQDRARRSNRPDRVEGISGRSALGRRRCDVFDALVNKLGGRDAISDAKMIEVTRAADLVVAARMFALAPYGVSRSIFSGSCGLRNLAVRAVRALGRKRRSAPDNPLVYARRRREGRKPSMALSPIQ